ncbi:MAG: site-2 protease family protein [Candidatus Anammoximicrobium sp.]|nr:site-2 protease family protein [Candidatus Anammoximicrobium sp.]
MHGNEKTSAEISETGLGDEDYVLAEVVQRPGATAASPQEPRQSRPPPIRRRRVKLPLILFLITCLSTFFAGAVGWIPTLEPMPIRRAILSQWQDGLIYMACILAILLTHEMGHFLVTLRYRIPASLPYFVPFPISPVGTMGAVIGMDGRRADRREMFDIGLAGPLAGLFVAVPILLVGIQQLDLSAPGHGLYRLDLPLYVRWTLQANPPPGYHLDGVAADQIWCSHLNPYFMAGWVGLLITGLNMMPVSQLDGGHVVYALFGRRSRWIARGFMVAAIAYMTVTQTWDRWALMMVLIFLIGIHHPPTRDDSVKLGWLRIAVGLASLAIPLLCFPPQVLHIVE